MDEAQALNDLKRDLMALSSRLTALAAKASPGVASAADEAERLVDAAYGALGRAGPSSGREIKSMDHWDDALQNCRRDLTVVSSRLSSLSGCPDEGIAKAAAEAERLVDEARRICIQARSTGEKTLSVKALRMKYRRPA